LTIKTSLNKLALHSLIYKEDIMQPDGNPNRQFAQTRESHIRYLKKQGVSFSCNNSICGGRMRTHLLISESGNTGTVRCKTCGFESQIEMKKAARLSARAHKPQMKDEEEARLLVSDVLEFLSFVNTKAKRLKLPDSFSIEWPAFSGCIKEALLAQSSCETLEDLPVDQAVTEETSAIVNAVKGWLCSQHHQFDTRFSK
jgi:hypothetical protein